MYIGMIEDKVQLKVYISKKVVDELRMLIMHKYDRYVRGLLSHEVELALQNYIAEFRRTHTNAHKISVSERSNPFPKVRIVFEQVKEWLRENYGYTLFDTIPKRHLIDGISAVRGSDPRTIRKWLREFEKAKLIKWISYGAVEVL